MDRRELRSLVREMRSNGKAYSEICHILQISIPKSTLATWCKGVILPPEYKRRLVRENLANLEISRQKSRQVKRSQRLIQLNSLLVANKGLLVNENDKGRKKTILAMLYLAEGGKDFSKVSVTFGNSDPAVITIFLKLLRCCYTVDEEKFRCTIQCRADQNTASLERFWCRLTDIPLSQFYSTRIDKRTVGQATKIETYKGVCRIDYFSSIVFFDLLCAIKVIIDSIVSGDSFDIKGLFGNNALDQSKGL